MVSIGWYLGYPKGWLGGSGSTDDVYTYVYLVHTQMDVDINAESGKQPLAQPPILGNPSFHGTKAVSVRLPFLEWSS